MSYGRITACGCTAWQSDLLLWHPQWPELLVCPHLCVAICVWLLFEMRFFCCVCLFPCTLLQITFMCWCDGRQVQVVRHEIGNLRRCGRVMEGPGSAGGGSCIEVLNRTEALRPCAIECIPLSWVGSACTGGDHRKQAPCVIQELEHAASCLCCENVLQESRRCHVVVSSTALDLRPTANHHVTRRMDVAAHGR